MKIWQQAQVLPALDHDLKLLIGPLIYPHELGEMNQIAAALGCSTKQLQKQLYAFFVRNEGSWFNRSADFETLFEYDNIFELSLEAGLNINLQQIWNQLPQGWEPDLIIWKHLFVFPPQDLLDCPCPVVLLAGDWHLQYAAVLHYLKAFDFVLGDRLLLQKLEQTQRCAYWPSYGYPQNLFQGDVMAERPWDLAFAGSLHNSIHAERNTYLYRLAQLGEHYRVRIETQLYDERYLKFWQQCKLAFNFALRKEMNLRAFEAVACGALLFQEESNLEIQAFLPPGEACVLYNHKNFESQIDYYLNHEQERQRIALEGQRRIQAFSYSRQTALLMKALPALIQALPDKKIRFHLQLPEHAYDLARVQQGFFSSHSKLHFQARQFLKLRIANSENLAAKRMYLNAYLISQIQCHWNVLDTPHLAAQDCLEIESIEMQLMQCQQHLGPHPLVQNSLIWSALARNALPVMQRNLATQAQNLSRLNVPDFKLLLSSPLEIWDETQETLHTELGLWGMVLMQGNSRFHMAWQQALSQPSELPTLLRWSFHYASGHNLLKAKNLKGAEQHFYQAVKLCPEFPEAYFSLAMVMLHNQQLPLAIESLRFGLMQGVFYPAEWRMLLRLLLDLNAVPPVLQTLKVLKTLFQSEFFSPFQQGLQKFEVEARQNHRDKQLKPPTEGFLD